MTVRHKGKKVRPRKDDRRAPKTGVRVSGKPSTAILRFEVKDASPVTTYVKVGKRVRRLKKRTKTLRLPVARLRKGVTVQSVDAFGNVERPKRVKRHIKRTKRRA